MADQRYRVMVVELDDVKPRNESGLENLLTLVTVSTPEERFARLVGPKPSPQWTKGHVVALRSDLSITKTYGSLDSAKKAERRLVDRLLRKGYIVNRRVGHRRVYVIELDSSHLAKPGKGYLYVGETSLTPSERFAKHKDDARNKNGKRIGSRFVRKKGLRLRPDLAPTGFALTKAEAEQAEADCRRRLEKLGYRCEGAHLAKHKPNPVA
jgi:hypothetical protein